MMIDTQTAKEIAALRDQQSEENRKARTYGAEWHRLSQTSRAAVTGGQKALKTRQRELQAQLLTEDTEANREELASIVDQLAQIELATPPAIEQVRREELKWKSKAEQTALKLKEITGRAIPIPDDFVDPEPLLKKAAQATFPRFIYGNADNDTLALQLLNQLTGGKPLRDVLHPYWLEMRSVLDAEIDQHRIKKQD